MDSSTTFRKVQFDFEFKGTPTEIRYYKSLTHFNTSNMPAPSAVNIQGKQYVDASAPLEDFYVIFSAVRDGSEYYSLEKLVQKIDVSKYTAYFKLDSFIDLCGGANLVPRGNAVIQDNSLYLDGAGDWAQRPETTATVFGSGDLTVECEFKCARIGTHTADQVLVDNFVVSQGGWQIGLNKQGQTFLYFNSPNAYPIVSQNSYSDGNWHKVKWTRQGGQSKMFVDDILVGTSLDARNFKQVPLVAIGAQVNTRNTSYDFKGWIRNVGYSKQVL